MAIPKVFVSSTCYDLQEERAQLERFITNYGFHPILSEYSGVYYDVDTHTHESCVNEVAHCDMFVLVISGRYGGKFKGGNGESITQAEYNKARELGLPIFTFVKSEVSAAQHYFKENVRANNEAFAKKITYPAIEKQADAVSIFGFIDSVQRSISNNGIETYQSFTEIEEHLKKQWAGMFFSFLQKRKEQDKVEQITTVLSKLSGSSSKLEALVSSLHDKEVGADETSKLIEKTQLDEDCLEFFQLIFKAVDESLYELKRDLDSNTCIDKVAVVVEDLKNLEVKETLAEYLSSIPSLHWTSKYETNNKTGKYLLNFPDLSIYGGFSNSMWRRAETLYNGAVINSGRIILQDAIVRASKSI
ncbi:DUF4062 domain-containing protein [Vibrio splendidus]|uniref:DUF4062 domain-containing protein n=1 Tax=Vibrio splendidus TaxID=29497 RepID=UPI0021B3A4C1|nr:DUF4062 domain-containing protein [Vibrio splendidus]UXA00409.1 DUF4062 domain-containing protein [Vibrio splendidus]